MSSMAAPHPFHEFEDELELMPELTHEAGSELEQEQFFGALARIASRAASSPALRRVALDAARTALGALSGGDESELESEFEDELGEHELSPIRRVYPDAMMEHLAHEAAEASSEQEAAEAFLPLIPLIGAKLLPLAMKAAPIVGKLAMKGIGKLASKGLGQLAKRGASRLARQGLRQARQSLGRRGPALVNQFMRNSPHMTRAVQNMSRKLYRNPRTRPLLRTMPAIARRASAQLLRGAARGTPITPKTAVRALARNAARVIANPSASVRAFQRSRSLDRSFHSSPAARAGAPGAASGAPAAGRSAGCTCGAAKQAAAQAAVQQAAQQATLANLAAAMTSSPAAATGGCTCKRCPTCGR